MQTDDPARIDRALALAEQQIPLDQIATGPALESGLGRTYALHGELDFILSSLDRFPRKGWPFIAAALRSPVIRNRNLAIRTLSAWGLENWPTEARSLVEQVMRDEPDEEVKQRQKRLIEGKPLE